MKNVFIILYCALNILGCLNAAPSVSTLAPTRDPVDDREISPEPKNRITLNVSSIQDEEGSSPWNTIKNTLTFNDAKILIKKAHLVIYETGDAKLSASFESLTPTTAKSFDIKDFDVGNIATWNFTKVYNDGSMDFFESSNITIDISADSKIRFIEFRVQYYFNSINDTYTKVWLSGSMVDGSRIDSNDHNHPYSIDLQ